MDKLLHKMTKYWIFDVIMPLFCFDIYTWSHGTSNEWNYSNNLFIISDKHANQAADPI